MRPQPSAPSTSRTFVLPRPQPSSPSAFHALSLPRPQPSTPSAFHALSLPRFSLAPTIKACSPPPPCGVTFAANVSCAVRLLAVLMSRGHKRVCHARHKADGWLPLWAQAVLLNLRASRVEYRCEEDPDVAPYVHPRSLEERVVPLPQAPPQGRGTLRLRLKKLLQQLPRVLPARALNSSVADRVCPAACTPADSLLPCHGTCRPSVSGNSVLQKGLLAASCPVAFQRVGAEGCLLGAVQACHPAGMELEDVPSSVLEAKVLEVAAAAAGKENRPYWLQGGAASYEPREVVVLLQQAQLVAEVAEQLDYNGPSAALQALTAGTAANPKMLAVRSIPGLGCATWAEGNVDHSLRTHAAQHGN